MGIVQSKDVSGMPIVVVVGGGYAGIACAKVIVLIANELPRILFSSGVGWIGQFGCDRSQGLFLPQHWRLEACGERGCGDRKKECRQRL